MAELTTLARPYARAAFEFARAAKALQSWSDAITAAATVSMQDGIKVLLSSPSLTTEQKGSTFVDVCGESLDAKQQNFIKVLAENNRLDLLPEVQKLFELYKANQEKSVDVDVQTAYELTPELEQKLIAALTKKLDREVTLQTSVDKNLLGGALVRAGDTVIDGSIRGRLSKLGDALSA